MAGKGYIYPDYNNEKKLFGKVSVFYLFFKKKNNNTKFKGVGIFSPS